MTKKIFTIGALIFAIAIGTYVIYNSGSNEESNVYFPNTNFVPDQEDKVNIGDSDLDKKEQTPTISTEENSSKKAPENKPDLSKEENNTTPDKSKDLDVNPNIPSSIKPRPYETGKKRFLNFFLPEGHGNWEYKEKRLIYGEPQSLFFRIVKKLIETNKYENVTENICNGIYGYFHDMEWNESEMEAAEPGSWLEEEGKLIWGEIWKYCSYFGPSEDNHKPDFWPYTTKKLRVPFVDRMGNKVPGKGLGYVREVEIVTGAYHIWFNERFKRQYKNKGAMY